MKIAYLSIDNPKDFKSWSGLKLNIYNLLKKNHNDVKIIGPLKGKRRVFYLLIREFFKIFRIKYEADRKKFLSKIYSKIISKKLKEKKFDCIFTSDTYLVSYLETNLPIFLWLDVTFKTYYDHYFNHLSIDKTSYDEANHLELLALKKAKKIILTSNWAKKQAIKNYQIPPSKIVIVPFGSNMTSFSYRYKRKEKTNSCNLVSVGVDWDRKGMDKAIEVCNHMNLRGLKTNLTIVGSVSNKKFPDYINQAGFLNKNSKSDFYKMIKIYKNSDFHILLSNKEACGVVFAEASQFGLYNITNNIGGIGGMVKNHYNGIRFKKNLSPRNIANYIVKIFKNKKKFYSLKKKSIKYYNMKLDWKINSKKIQKIIENK